MNFTRLSIRRPPMIALSHFRSGKLPNSMHVRRLNMPSLRLDTKEQISRLTLPFLLCTVLGSFSVNLLWTRMEHQEYKEKMELKVQLLEERLQQLQNGEISTEEDLSNSTKNNKLELPIVIPKAKIQTPEETVRDPTKPRSFI
ncbi:hypothetical protein K7432_012162 [Basidiobolus ranarum]|uniref:Uncharacterized protein n=1 Tax=Basidiobolus ranarum TaxID=34480 RepID=A0ABR2WLD1_9FUNG